MCIHCPVPQTRKQRRATIQTDTQATCPCVQIICKEFSSFLSAVSAYTAALKSSILGQTEFQQFQHILLPSRAISNAKTDEIFINLLVHHGRKVLVRNDKTNTRSEKLEYYGKVIATPVEHCDKIFIEMSDDHENPNSILVVGKAGIGKSLFCQKLIRDWANAFHAKGNAEILDLKFAYLLTFRQLNMFGNHPVTLREILNCTSVQDDNSNMDDFIFEYIVKHPRQAMIIIDGYDEYSQQDYIAGNLEEEHLNDARCEMPVAALCSKLIKGKILRGAIVMVTSRPDESDKMGGIRFKRYVEIAGFSSEQVKKFIEKYFKKNENMKNAVLKHVMNNEHLVRFAHIPILCFVLCFEMEYILDSGNLQDLPVSVTDIYTKLMDIFELKFTLESEYRQEEIPEQFKPPSFIPETFEKLSRLAAKLLLERKPTFDESEMEGDFEADEVDKLKRSGLLYCGQSFRTASITTARHLSFFHQTLQEFLAARWFVKENRVPHEKCSEMVFQFMAGLMQTEGNVELMVKLLDSPFIESALKITCLNEYQSKEFAKKFIRNNPQAFCISDGVMALENLSDVNCIEASFVLDTVTELNREEAGEAQHKCADKFVTVKKLELKRSQLTLYGLQRLCNSLNNGHCLVSELNLLSSDLTDECVYVINRVVVRKLITLSLQQIEITNTGVASLCEALQHPSCKLTTLNLEGIEFTDTSVAMLSEALQHPSCKLATLTLQANEISDTGVASLGEALQHPCCKLTTLNLGGNEITATRVAMLSEALQHQSCKLTTLNLGVNEISDTGVASLCEALQHQSCKLTTLNLKGNEITDTGVASLCETLQRPSCKLTTLNLRANEISDTGAASLCEALQHPSCKLTALNLEGNEISDTGAASLCEALQHPSCKLTTLNLGGNEITDTGVASHCEALTHPSCKLTTLNLRGNEITDTGVVSLCEALQHPSCKLTTLNLGGNEITDTGVASLCEALQHPSCKLTTLNLRGNEISDTGVASLCEALQHQSCRLTTLNLRSNEITDTGVTSDSSREPVRAIVHK